MKKAYVPEMPLRNRFTCPNCGEDKLEAYYASINGEAHYNNVKGISVGYRTIFYTDIEDFEQKAQMLPNMNHCTCFTCGHNWEEYRSQKGSN